jgi:hypothetical protein
MPAPNIRTYDGLPCTVEHDGVCPLCGRVFEHPWQYRTDRDRAGTVFAFCKQHDFHEQLTYLGRDRNGRPLPDKKEETT